MDQHSKALQTRYGNTSLSANGPWSNVIEALLAHRSVRAFTTQELPEGTLETLIAAAQSAATSSNLQTWSVVAIKDNARKDRLATLAGNQQHVRDSKLFLVWLADLSRIDRIAQQHDADLEALPYLENLLLASIDASLAAQNAVVALESLGLGAVYVGGIRNNIDKVSQELNLPQHVYPVFGLSIGYPDQNRPTSVKPRLPQEAILHHETYSTEGEEATISSYDQQLAEFYATQGMNPSSWSAQVIKRLSNVSSLHGRERLAEILKGRGFHPND